MARGDFIEQLRAMGYEPQDRGDGKIAVPYTIETGKFTGQQIKLGFVAADDYNLNPPSCVHVSPHLLPLHPGSDLPHPAGGVHPNQSFDGDFQYWSRPIKHWQATERTARAVIAHVRRLFDTQ
jgi:hypothetical protein